MEPTRVNQMVHHTRIRQHNRENSNEDENNDSFGKRFFNSKLEEIPKDVSLLKINVIGLFFTASWCPPCEAFQNDLLQVYNEINLKEKVFEIIQISNERNEQEYRTFIQRKEFPWLCLAHNDPTINNIVNEFKIKHLPMLVIVNKEKVLLSDTGRKDIIDYPGAKVFVEKWYKAYRSLKDNQSI